MEWLKGCTSLESSIAQRCWIFEVWWYFSRLALYVKESPYSCRSYQRRRMIGAFWTPFWIKSYKGSSSIFTGEIQSIAYDWLGLFICPYGMRPYYILCSIMPLLPLVCFSFLESLVYYWDFNWVQLQEVEACHRVSSKPNGLWYVSFRR